MRAYKNHRAFSQEPTVPTIESLLYPRPDAIKRPDEGTAASRTWGLGGEAVQPPLA